MIIYKIKDIPKSIYGMIGGKARGLRELINAKLKVPEGFIVADINREEDYSFTVDYYSKSGLKGVVLRSSVPSDEGEQFSAVNHRAITLNITDKHKLLAAIKKATESLKSYISTDYCSYFDNERMGVSLVVQAMVDVKFSGVCFSKNPLTGESEMVIEAIRGTQDKSKCRRYIVNYKEEEGQLSEFNINNQAAGGKLLSNQQIESLCNDLAKAVKHFGTPLNMEFVIDKEGEIYWLQAKKITTLEYSSITELDGFSGDENTIFTTLGLPSILPPMATPLTKSTIIAFLDNAMRTELIRAGVPRGAKQLPQGACLVPFSCHLFLNATSFQKMSSTLLKTDLTSLERAIFTKELEAEMPAKSKQNVFLRCKNTLSYLNYFLSKRSIKKIDDICAFISIKEEQSPSELYENISLKLDALKQALHYYYQTVVHLRIMNMILTDAIEHANGDKDKLMPALLSEIEGYERVDIMRLMKKVAAETVRKYPAAADFSAQKLKSVIESEENEIKNAYNNLIMEFGHRCSADAELMNKPWEKSNLQLIENILSLIRGDEEEDFRPTIDLDTAMKKVLKPHKCLKKSYYKYIISRARWGKFAKEYTESQLIKIIDKFKEAYESLANLMVKRKIMSDAELIYFLTHEELKGILRGKEQIHIKHAMQRKKQFAYSSTQSYELVVKGKPKPKGIELSSLVIREELSGTPASYGEARGRARVVKRPEEMGELKEGEILVVQCTDLRWSDYYGTIAGLIAETGTMLSDDAILTREYGVPLVIGVSEATKLIKTGDYLHLNARQGTISILDNI